MHKYIKVMIRVIMGFAFVLPCGYSAMDNSNQNQHVAVSKKIICDRIGCGQTFSALKPFFEHKKIMHGTKYYWCDCGNLFGALATLSSKEAVSLCQICKSTENFCPTTGHTCYNNSVVDFESLVATVPTSDLSTKISQILAGPQGYDYIELLNDLCSPNRHVVHVSALAQDPDFFDVGHPIKKGSENTMFPLEYFPDSDDFLK
ncbi:MAG: hypothetical protein NTX86_01045 [Candidatus Dependentiae bacterium]|nr:hypothetical protein [Candidatus Dependentiae bacterium]